MVSDREKSEVWFLGRDLKMARIDDYKTASPRQRQGFLDFVKKRYSLILAALIPSMHLIPTTIPLVKDIWDHLYGTLLAAPILN